MPDIQMTPGNRDPNRYRGKAILSASLVALVMGGAPAIDIFRDFAYENEGSRLTAYPDGENIWTICGGLTRYQGKPVTKGMKLTRQQCQEADDVAFRQALDEAEGIIAPHVWAQMSEATKAAIADLVHNLGKARAAGSTAVRELNAGHINEGCAAITLWVRDRGRDCRKAGSNCQGQPIRRMKQDALCLIPKDAS